MAKFNIFLSSWVALVWLWTTYTVGGILATVKILLPLLLVLACIWDGDWVAHNLLGMEKEGTYYSKSPVGIFFTVAGWFLLIGLPMMLLRHLVPGPIDF